MQGFCPSIVKKTSKINAFLCLTFSLNDDSMEV